MLIGPTITGSSSSRIGVQAGATMWMLRSRPRELEVPLRHVLAEDLARAHADRHQRAHVADERQHRVAPLERVRGRDRLPFLPEAAIEAADHLALPEQDDEPLLDVARQPREVVHLEQLVAVCARSACGSDERFASSFQPNWQRAAAGAGAGSSTHDRAPCAACAASPTASDIVGCAWMVRISSSTVHSRRSASVASATSSVERGPIMCTPRISSYFLSETILTKPSVSPAILARPSTPNLNVPILHVVAALLRLGLGQADAADLRIAVGAARDVVVVDRPELAGRRCARRARCPRPTRGARAAGGPACRR